MTLHTKAVDLLASPKIALDGTASLGRRPVGLSTLLAIEGERIAATKLALALGTSRLTGDVAMANKLLTGKLALSAPDLREIGPARTTVKELLSGLPQ